MLRRMISVDTARQARTEPRFGCSDASIESAGPPWNPIPNPERNQTTPHHTPQAPASQSLSWSLLLLLPFGVRAGVRLDAAILSLSLRVTAPLPLSGSLHPHPKPCCAHRARSVLNKNTHKTSYNRPTHPPHVPAAAAGADWRLRSLEK